MGIDRNKKYTLADFAEIIEGKVAVPNYETMDAGDALNLISYLGTHVEHDKQCYAVIAGSPEKRWARYFLFHGQGGGLTGEGVVISYGGHKSGNAGRFAICKHKKVTGPGANPSRGWHPGHCELCGLDMSVDSGD